MKIISGHVYLDFWVDLWGMAPKELGTNDLLLTIFLVYTTSSSYFQAIFKTLLAASELLFVTYWHFWLFLNGFILFEIIYFLERKWCKSIPKLFINESDNWGYQDVACRLDFAQDWFRYWYPNIHTNIKCESSGSVSD